MKLGQRRKLSAVKLAALLGLDLNKYKENCE